MGAWLIRCIRCICKRCIWYFITLQNFMACVHVKRHKRCQQTCNRIDRIRETLAGDVFRSSATRLLIIAKEGCFIMFLDWNIRFLCDLPRMTEERIWLDLLCAAQRPIKWHTFPNQTIYGSMDLEAKLNPCNGIFSHCVFFYPRTTLPAGITRKFIADILLPNSRQIHPNVDCCFSDPSLTQVCMLFWISCPPTTCAQSKWVFQSHLFHSPPSSTVPKLEVLPGVLVPKTQKSHHPYSTGHGHGWIFGKFPCHIISIASRLPPFCQG